MKILKAKRAVIKGTLTRIASFTSSITNKMSVEDCQLRLDRLENAWIVYQEIQGAMLEKSDNPECLVNDPDLVESENKYFELKSILLTKVKDASLDTGEANHTDNDEFNQGLKQLAKQHTELMQKISSSVSRVEQQLPKINIKKFAGDFSD